MKVTLKGNTAVVETNVKVEDYDKYKGYGVFTVEDTEGNGLFVLGKGTKGSVSPYGITCNTVVNGNLAASFLFEGTAADTKKKLDPSILALKEFEQAIEDNIMNIEARLEGIADVVTIEE